MLLEHVKGISVDTELEAEYAKLEEQVSNMLDHISILTESPMGDMGDRMQGGDQRMGMGNMPPPPGEVDPSSNADGAGDGSEANMDEVMSGMETVIKQMSAAKRGLGMINTMSDSPYRTKNRSRIMSNMNKIRANLQRIEKLLGGDIQENIDHVRANQAIKAQNKRGLKNPFGLKKKKKPIKK